MTARDAKAPHPYLVAWLRTFTSAPLRKRCLVVGCGLGDDAEALASAGFDVTAFDPVPTAIDAARRRFPRSGVEYVVADVIDPPPAWMGAFDLVFAADVLDALAPERRRDAVRTIAQFVAPGGRVVVVGGAEPDGFVEAGLSPGPVIVGTDERTTPPTRRIQAFFERREE